MLFLLWVGLTFPLTKDAVSQGKGSLDLLSHLNFSVEKVRDVWGFEGIGGGEEYALVGYRDGRDRGIFVVDVSDATSPKIVSTIKSVPSFDIKTFKQYAYAVYGSPEPEARVLDLTRPDSPRVVGAFPSAHNIFIDEKGYLYLEDPGLRIFDLNPDPTRPELIWDDADTNQDGHDAAVFGDLLYDFHGHSGTRIYNISNRQSPRLLGLVNDPSIAFHHSGWVTEDKGFLLICNELAKTNSPSADITVWDVRDAGNPLQVGEYADPSATVHNLYVVGDYAFVAYYNSGLRILDISDPANPTEVATYDTAPDLRGPELTGAFGVYPFSPSGNIYVTDTQGGLFLFSFSALNEPADDPTDPQPGVPFVSSFQPTKGPIGSIITINGSHFLDVNTVKVGDAAVLSFDVVSQTRIHATVPFGATSGRLSVTSVDGTSESAAAFTVTPPKEAADSEFLPSDDTFVWSKKPDQVNGSEDELRARKTRSADQFTYIKFPVAGLTGEINSAKMRLFVLDGSDTGGEIYSVSNNDRMDEVAWAEDGLNWHNAPLLTGAVLSSPGAVASGNYVEFDVTPAVQGNGIYSFALRSKSSDAVKYSSKEGPFPPVLIVDSDSSPAAPVIASFTPAQGTVGIQVTIRGSGFSDALSVRFGDTDAVSFVAESESKILATVPQAATSGWVHVSTLSGTARSTSVFTVTRPDQTTEFEFTPSNDSFVWSKRPVNDNGAEDELRARKTNRADQFAYMKIPVSGLDGPIIRATIRLFVFDGSDDGGQIYAVSNNYRDDNGPWTESGLTWANAPLFEGAALSSLSTAVTGNYVEFDVTTTVRGNGLFSFAIKNSSSDAVKYGSKEGPNPPVLFVGVGPISLDTPIITSFAPAAGAPGTQVTIYGRNFFEVAMVTFSGKDAAVFAVTSTSSITASVPLGAITGKIAVATATDTARSAGDFTVLEGDANESRTFLPSDDSFVWSKNHSKVYGQSRELRIRKSSARQIIFLKFQVERLLGRITEVKLRLFVTDDSDDGGAVYLVANEYGGSNVPWVESGLNWNNAPLVESLGLSSVGAVSAGQTVEFDLTSLVLAAGTYSFAIQNKTNDAAIYSSKEGAVSPELIIVTQGGDTGNVTTLGASASSIIKIDQDSPTLAANYPNPFNIETSIAYSLPESGDVWLSIFNVRGQRIRSLVRAYQRAGFQTARWDGKDDFGAVVGSGVYFFLVTTDTHQFSGRMILQK